jgi:hypothetical protein
MGFLRRGSPRDRFAKQVLEAVLATGAVARAWYEPEAFAVRFQRGDDGDTGWIYLHNTFRETEDASRSERQERVRRLVAAVVHEPRVDRGWDEVRPRLRPVLRGATFGQGMSNGDSALLSRPALPYLVELVVVDEPTSMAYVLEHHAREWGVDADEIFAAAHANLAPRATSATQGEPRDGPAMIRFVDTGDAYFTSMLLIDGFLAGLTPRVGGRPVAFVPDKDTLAVLGDDHPEALAQFYEMMEHEYRDAVRSLSPVGYTTDDSGRVVPYRTTEPGPLANRVHRAEVMLAAAEYNAQKEALDARHERDGVDLFVATVMAVERPDGSTFSVSVWTDNCDTLLPETDHVFLQSSEREAFAVPWPIVAAEASFAPVPGISPPRFRVRTWPDEPVLHRLRAESINL